MWAGFNSSQYFATAFHKRYRKTPAEFRTGISCYAWKQRGNLISRGEQKTVP